MSRRICRHRLAPEIQRLLPVDAKDRVTIGEVADFLEHAYRMDVAILGIFVGTRAGPLGGLAFRQLLPPRLIAVLRHLALDAVEQLPASTILQSPTMGMST